MKHEIRALLKNAGTFDDIFVVLFNLFKEVRLDSPRLGYVSGIVSSDGPEKITRNLERLSIYSIKVGHKYKFPVFSSGDIFGPELMARVLKDGPDERAFQKFWREILETGFISDIFMTPEWERSVGAADEHEIAKKLKLQIHYL